MYLPFFHDIAKREVPLSDSAAAIKEWPEPEVVRSHTAAPGPVRARVWGISAIQYGRQNSVMAILHRARFLVFSLPFSFPKNIYHLIVQFIARSRTISESGSRMGARNNDLHKDDDFLVSSMVRCKPVIRTRSPSGQT